MLLYCRCSPSLPSSMLLFSSFSIVFDMMLCQHFFLFVSVLASCGWQQLEPWHSNELAAARRAACRVGPPGSSFVSDDILISPSYWSFLESATGRAQTATDRLSSVAAVSACVPTPCVCACIPDFCQRAQEPQGRAKTAKIGSGPHTRFRNRNCRVNFGLRRVCPVLCLRTMDSARL